MRSIARTSITAERFAARADVALGELRRTLQLGAIDGVGAAGTAVVHEQHVVTLPQRPKKRQIIVAGVGGGVAGPSLSGAQRSDAGPGTGMRVILEIDRDG